MMLLPHIAGRVFDTPLLIARAKLDVILGVIIPRFCGHDLPPNFLSVATGGYEVTPDGVALLPVYGTLVRRTVGLAAQSGLTSYATLAQQLAAALADQSVKAILLDIDSPGGEAGGVFDLADQIFAARKVKPIWAVADEEAYSAAYALAASASKIYIPRTGGVGSIGVIAVHCDQSQADTDEGLKYTAIYAGDHKNDLSPHEPLSDPARANLQTEVSRVYDLFVAAVARARKLDPDAVKATEAKLFFGPDAVAASLADKSGTFQDALTDLTASVKPTPRRLGIAPLRNLSRKDTAMTTESDPHANTETETAAPLATARPATPSLDLENVRAQARADARAEALAYVAEVNELCQLAGRPEKATAFIAKGTPTAEIRHALLNAKAAASDALTILSQHDGLTSGAAAPQIDTAAIYAARNAQSGKPQKEK